MKHVARSPVRHGMLERFNHLLRELRDGTLHRNAFRRWEAEIIMDMLACNADDTSMSEILRRYQKAAQRRLERGSNPPMKLSEYLEAMHARRGRAA